ncbi:hypothetical protein FJU61_01965 [Acinetobacter baumannii]|nr:hypothetical protein FJU61_01965 [Acinetobacter baumannii]
MFGELVKKIKAWYKGDPGLIDSNPATGIDTVIREPYRSPLAKLVSYFIRPIGWAYNFFIQEWKFIITTFLVILNFVYTHSINKTFKQNNQEYSRCEVQKERGNEITFHCLKRESH